MKPVRIQRYIAFLSVVLFAGKLIAWYLTHSVTVLTDALEGTVNMATGFLGLYAIILASKPRDTNHPYGHGKAEFLSSAVEGTLISVAGVTIVYEAIHRLFTPHELDRLDTGLIIVGVAGVINFLAGTYAEAQGKKNNSLILISAGKHLKTDAYSTVAVLVGLGVIMATANKWPWLDSAIALLFALNIMITGYKVLRRSVSGIMDEMDMKLLAEVIELLQKNRAPQWVDLHNLRVIHYGNMMHVDAHMTLPWYYTVARADEEIHAVEKLINTHFNCKVEVFIHIDGCKPYQCKLCALQNCDVRQEPFYAQMEWTVANMWPDEKHGKNE
jgi:cation diffusion facilitator family transporter